MNLAPRDKWRAIESLVDVLIEENQLPAQMRAQVIDTAFKREQSMPTLAGCETAIPHAALPEFKGVAGCLGICPKGVRFGDDGSAARLVFFLLTSKDKYDDYLKALAMIARVVHDEEARTKILGCQTPAEVIGALLEGELRRKANGAGPE